MKRIKTNLQQFVCIVFVMWFIFVPFCGIVTNAVNETTSNIKQTEEKMKAAKDEYEQANNNYQTLISQKEETNQKINDLKKELAELDNYNADSVIIPIDENI